MMPWLMPLLMLIIAAIGLLLTMKSNTAAASRIEGVITTSLQDQARRIDEHKADTTKRIDEVKKDFEKDVQELKEMDDKQWKVIRESEADVNTIKGRLNGKAFGATQ